MESVPPVPVVLVVDDDDAVRRAIARLVRAAGWTVEVFDSGESLLHRGRLSAAGCLVVDLRMPGMDGLELQRRLRQMNCRTPLIMISAHDDETARSQAMGGGAAQFVRKPFREDELIEAIRGAMASH